MGFRVQIQAKYHKSHTCQSQFMFSLEMHTGRAEFS